MSKKLYTPKQALNNISDNYFNGNRNLNYELEQKWFHIIETSLKALEIIKEKRVNVEHFCLIQVFSKEEQLERYNDTDFIPKIYFLTQEEYYLLKEVLL